MDISADLIGREILEVVPVVMSAIRTEMRSRRSTELSVMQFRALIYLKSYPAASLSALADHLGLTLPTVSQMINAMVAGGLVIRVDCPADRRRVELSLTDMGEKSLENAYKGTQAHLAGFLAQLSPAERIAVHQVMLLLKGLFSQPVVSHVSQEREKT